MNAKVKTSGVEITPILLNLSSEKIDRGGAYVIDNGIAVYFFFTKEVPQLLCQDLLGVAGFPSLPQGKVCLYYLIIGYFTYFR